MATRTQSRQSNRTHRAEQLAAAATAAADSAAPFHGAKAPARSSPLALAGAAIGFAANYGRKFSRRPCQRQSGDWDEILATEHDMALAVFDKMLATDQTQTWKRSMLLMQLTHALDKHAHEEEMVVYPALREADQAAEADQLNAEHGYIKTFLYELGEMGPDAPNWLEKVREFRALVAEHAKMEEEQVFPTFKATSTRSRTRRSPRS